MCIQKPLFFVLIWENRLYIRYKGTKISNLWLNAGSDTRHPEKWAPAPAWDFVPQAALQSKSPLGVKINWNPKIGYLYKLK